jgi:hypothetical protein
MSSCPRRGWLSYNNRAETHQNWGSISKKKRSSVLSRCADVTSMKPESSKMLELLRWQSGSPPLSFLYKAFPSPTSPDGGIAMCLQSSITPLSKRFLVHLHEKQPRDKKHKNATVMGIQITIAGGHSKLRDKLLSVLDEMVASFRRITAIATGSSEPQTSWQDV